MHFGVVKDEKARTLVCLHFDQVTTTLQLSHF